MQFVECEIITDAIDGETLSVMRLLHELRWGERAELERACYEVIRLIKVVNGE